jgi:hypothetical protein
MRTLRNVALVAGTLIVMFGWVYLLVWIALNTGGFHSKASR